MCALRFVARHRRTTVPVPIVCDIIHSLIPIFTEFESSSILTEGTSIRTWIFSSPWWSMSTVWCVEIPQRSLPRVDNITICAKSSRIYMVLELSSPISNSPRIVQFVTSILVSQFESPYLFRCYHTLPSAPNRWSILSRLLTAWLAVYGRLSLLALTKSTRGDTDPVSTFSSFALGSPIASASPPLPILISWESRD